MTLVDIEAPPAGPRMKGKQYAILPVGGTKLEGWPRATTVAKTFDDSFGLEGHWKAHTLIGAHINPALAGLCAAAHQEGDKRKAKQYAEQAFEVAGGNVKRDRGTLVHDYVEQKIADPTWEVPELYRAQVEAIIAGIAAAGFTVVVEFSERLLVHDRYKIAGRCDFILRHEATGIYYVGDLKTGSAGFPLPWAIQLAIYANADAAYNQGAADDGSEDTRDPLPPLDRERAIIINSPLDTTDVDLYWIDIATGATLLDLAIEVRKARNLKSKVLTKFEGGGTTSTAGTAEVVGSVEDNQPNAAALAILHEARVAWLRRRVDHLVATLSKRHVAEAWPVDVPTPKAVTEGATWGDGDIDAIVSALDALEAKHDVDFGDEDPARAQIRRATSAERALADVVQIRPEPVALDDGGIADDDDVQRLLDNVRAMAQSPDAAVRERVQRVALWQRQADTTPHPWRSRQGTDDTTPMRVYVVLLAAVACLDHIDLKATDPDHKVRALLTAVVGDDGAKPNNSIGQLIGALTVDQAIELGALAG